MTTQNFIPVYELDSIELDSTNETWPISGRIVGVANDTVVVSIVDSKLGGTIPRDAITADEFGALSAPLHRVVPILHPGEVIHSARGFDTHGCRAGFTATVMDVSEGDVAAQITSNTVCGGSWQTGCTGEGYDNDLKGDLLLLKERDCRITADLHLEVV